MSLITLIRIDDDIRRIVEEADDDFAKVYGVSLGGNKQVVREVVSQTLSLLRKAPRASEWGGYLVADRERSMVIGTCGFKHGPEANGTVEIAYFTFQEFEQQGYATAMAKELVKLALQSEDVREIIAHTLPERNASTWILEKAGLRLVGEIDDLEDGKVWRWVYHTGT